MAISVPNGTVVSDKWKTRATAAATDFKNSVSTAGARWQAATADAEPMWQAGVLEAISNHRYVDGSAGKGNVYQANAMDKGFRNYGPGVQAGQPKYTTQITKVLGVIAGVTLPAPGGKDSPQNYQRSAAIGNALHAAKLAGTFN